MERKTRVTVVFINDFSEFEGEEDISDQEAADRLAARYQEDPNMLSRHLLDIIPESVTAVAVE